MEIFTIIEIAAVILGLISVYLTTKENIWCWPTGIVMVILYVMIFFNAKLYSDMLENFIYIFMQIYGWWFWLHGGNKKEEAKVSILKNRMRIFWGIVIVIGAIGLGYSMANFTDASFPYVDAFTTVMSLTAQWLMGKKILENWVLWITVDVIAVVLYFVKGLMLTSGLYALFLILAIMGLRDWTKSRNERRQIV